MASLVFSVTPEHADFNDRKMGRFKLNGLNFKWTQSMARSLGAVEKKEVANCENYSDDHNDTPIKDKVLLREDRNITLQRSVDLQFTSRV